MGDAVQKSEGAAAIGTLVDLHVQLLKMASMIHRPMREGVAEPGGIGLDEVKIIMCLGGEGAMAGHEISDVMGIPPMNVSRALASLEGRGWIERVSDAADRRRKPVQLTAKGVEANRSMTPDIARVADYLLGGLPASERAVMARALARVIGRIEDWASGSEG